LSEAIILSKPSPKSFPPLRGGKTKGGEPLLPGERGLFGEALSNGDNMEKGLRWKFLVILIACGIAVFALYPVAETLHLGLDLQGGAYLVYQIDETRLDDDVSVSDAAERAMEIIRTRIDEFGVREPEIQLTGQNQLIISLPGVTDTDRAREIIGRTAMLEFRRVAADVDRQQVEAGVAPGYEILEFQDQQAAQEQELVVETETELTGEHLTDARVQFGDRGPAVSITFDAAGGEIFGDITSAIVGERLAIVIDDQIVSAPSVNEPIYGGEAQITGRFTDQEASDLALMLRAGALPAPLEQIEQRSVGPSLGEDSIRAGLLASLVALVAVMIFMAVYYKLAGLIANITLMLCLLFLMGGLAGFGATLTLPGIAGIILTIGMSVDANVIVFERIKEELAEGKPLRTSINDGFDNAFSAIVDAQVTTIITAIALYWFGTGPVRGFAVTLILGIISSLFSALFIGKFLFAVVTLRRRVDRIHIGWGRNV